MQFLSPWYIPAAAAALTIPPLIIMYFLRLRRRETPVPTTYLWRRVIEDMQVNMPFQKLRRNLLLLLQLLVLFAAIYALGRPVRQVSALEDERIILMIDRSASMSAQEGPADRLAQAKQQAQALMRGLKRSQKVMVIAFADTAEVVCPFTADKGLIAERIRAIEPSDRPTKLDEAVRLAKAYATPFIPPEGETNRTEMPSTEPPAKAVIFSDGAVADARQVTASRLKLEYVKIGAADNNVGITAIEARREYTNPQQVQLFLRLQNFSPNQDVKTSVAIYVNNELSAAKDVDLPATPPTGQSEQAAASQQVNRMGGSQTVAFDLSTPEAATIEARLQLEDALTADNTARVVLPPARQSSALLVTSGNLFLNKVLAGLPLQKFQTVKPEEYEAAAGPAAGRNFDVVVFDRFSPARLDEGNYIFFGAVPPNEGFSRGDDVDEAYVVDFDSMHPIMRHVSIDEILVAKWNPTHVPKGSLVLLETSVGPAIAYTSSAQQQIVTVSFNLSNSIWPLQVSFPVFMYNTVRYLTGSAMQAERALRPGQTLDITVPEGLKDITVETPDHQHRQLSTAGQKIVRFPGTEQTGLYRVQPAGVGVSPETFAVNLADANESDIVPREVLTVGADAVATSASLQGANQPLWPYAILIALGILCLEWYIYNRRVMV